ncbi:response regulator [Actinomadura rudentiformis]|uniref:Response regulator transcription factor n=1 Tax=Actinomadura rudentiformis TaxID=359158 RepID=A0A6H9YQB3_9ACTN|nr:response regulator [Actinomadura rudentiformis]KAB2350124.1 response regulator transcription factor [Actinomadura rudentiformis]
MRVLIVEDESYLAEAIRDGLRLEAIAADIACDGECAWELLVLNSYDLAVLDRDIPAPSGFGIGADDHLTKPFDLREAVLRLDPFCREVFRDGRHVALTDPFTNAVRITVSALGKRLGQPWLIATEPGVGYRIDTGIDPVHPGGTHE